MAKKKRGLGKGLTALFGETMNETEVGTPASRESSDETDETQSSPTQQAVQKDSAAPASRVEDDENVVITTQEAENAVVKERASSAPRQAASAPNKKKIQGQVTSREVASAKPSQEELQQALNEGKKRGLTIDLSLIHPNPDQPRTYFNNEQIQELAASIKKEGLLQPIVIREDGKDEDGRTTYQIIAGERRWQACKTLHMKNVPVRIMQANDDKALQLALIENVQRTDLNPIEEAYGYKRLMERLGMTQTQVAQAVSKGRSTIANKLRLLDLPEEAQKALFDNKITTGHAVAILQVPSAEGQKALTQKVLDDHLNVRQTESLARLMAARENGTQAATKRPPMPLYFKNAAKELRGLLHTKVRMSSAKGKNKIEIEFKDEGDLERIFSIITHEASDKATSSTDN